MSDLFGNHIVGFPTRRLISLCISTLFLFFYFYLFYLFFFFFVFCFFFMKEFGSAHVLHPMLPTLCLVLSRRAAQSSLIVSALGPVVQNFVSLTTLLRPQLVK